MDANTAEAPAHPLRLEDEFRTWSDLVDDPLLLTARHGSIVSCNSSAERLLGRPRRELVGHRLQDLIADPATGESCLDLGSRSSQWMPGAVTVLAREPVPCRCDGAAYHGHVVLRLRPKEAADLGFEVLNRGREIERLAHEISQRKAAQQQLAAAHAHLEDRVRERTAELEHANRELAATAARLREAISELEQFNYISSHDLQEPLRMVTMYMALLQRRLEPRLGREESQWMRHVRDGADRMRLLIEDLLAYSRIDRPIGGAVVIDARAAAAEARQNLLPLIADSRADVQIRDLPRVAADHVQLVQVFQNLLGNAIKYRARGHVPKVVVSAAVDGGVATVRVSDNGIGIAPEHHQRIFQVFQRLHHRHEYPGSGMGLAICAKIIARHGGRIWVESSEDAGATFCFTLPVEESR